jgi:adenylyl-sulfate kinase
MPVIRPDFSPHAGLTVWLTGLSGAGKSTLAEAVSRRLLSRGRVVTVLDADILRKTLNSDLGFSKEDRVENVRRIAVVAKMLASKGIIVLVAAISPYRRTRHEIRESLGCCLEVYVAAPLSVCEERDPKGLYRKARAGELHNFTGIDDPYEEPIDPDLRCYTHLESIEQSSENIILLIDCYFSMLSVSGDSSLTLIDAELTTLK